MKKLSQKLIYIRGLLILLLGSYLSFLLLDWHYHTINSVPSLTLKYASIMICFLLSIMIGSDFNNELDKKLLQAGLFFTLLADLCLLILNMYVLGITLFILTQMIYIIRYQKKLSILSIQVFILGSIYSLAVLYILTTLPKMINPSVLLLAFIYGFMLFFSIWSAFSSSSRCFYSKSTYFIIITGMIFFFLCDISVAKFNIESTPSFKTSFAIWFFYVPSQTLLSLSGYKANYFKKIILPNMALKKDYP